MVAVAIGHEVIHFNSVEDIKHGLTRRGLKLHAAIEAASRYVYPADHDEERRQIVEEIAIIGHSTTSRETWQRCCAALYCLDFDAFVQLQKTPPQKKVVLVELTSEEQMKARKKYPYAYLPE